MARWERMHPGGPVVLTLVVHVNGEGLYLLESSDE